MNNIVSVYLMIKLFQVLQICKQKAVILIELKQICITYPFSHNLREICYIQKVTKAILYSEKEIFLKQNERLNMNFNNIFKRLEF